jgi:hypothetical protein
MTKKQVKDYFTSAKTAPYDTAPEGESLSWIPQVSPEAALERKALVFGLDPRPPEPPKVVAQAGREPAATPVEYTAPMNADQRVLEQLSALNGGMTPAIDPTVRVPDQVVNGLYPREVSQGHFPSGPPPTRGSQGTVIPSFDPAFVDLTRPTTGPTTRPQIHQQAATNVLRDSAGNPVISGNGNPIGIPNQTVGNTASGGKGGANYQSGDALKQITGGK